MSDKPEPETGSTEEIQKKAKRQAATAREPTVEEKTETIEKTIAARAGKDTPLQRMIDDGAAAPSSPGSEIDLDFGLGD